MEVKVEGAVESLRSAPAMTRRAVEPGTVLAVASLGVVMAFVDATIVNVAFPDIQRTFAESELGSLSWVLNAYNIVFAAFLVGAGRLSDLLGRKRLFELGIGLFTLASVLCAVAPTLELLVAARALQACGAAVVVPASLALVLHAYRAEGRTRAVTLWSASALLAAGIGPSLGGVLVEAQDWRLCFLVNLPVGLAALVLSRRKLVESRAPGRRSVPDLLGALVLALAVGALTLGIVKGEDWGWTSTATLGTLAASLVLTIVFARRCATHRSPVIDLALVRIRGFSVANLLTIVAAAGFFSYLLCNVLFLTGVWQYSVLEASLALTPGPAVAVLVAPLVGPLVGRIGHRAVLLPGLVIWGAGALYLREQVGVTPEFVSEWLPGMVILGIGAGVGFPTASSAAVAAAPGGRFATATGLNSVARQLGAALGVALLVVIVGTPSPAAAPAAFDDGWLFAAVCFGAAAVLGLVLGRIPAPEDEQVAPRTAFEPPPRPRPDTGPTEVSLPASLAGLPDEDVLARTPIFAGLDTDTRALVAECSERVSIKAGDWLFRAGDAADALYIVRRGRLEVVKEHGVGSTTRIAEVARGEVIGELGLLSETPRLASVRAARHTDLLRVRGDDLDALQGEAPELSRALIRDLAGRLDPASASGEVPDTPPKTIALVGLSPSVDALGLAARLAEHLGRLGTAALVRPHEVGHGPDQMAAWTEFTERCEQGHERVVLAAGAFDSNDPWTAFCLQHADRVLACCDSPDPPHGLPGRAALHGCDLVICGERLGAHGAEAWLDKLEPRTTHRLMPDDLERGLAMLARRVAGRSPGIVLSGGGARTLMHIGILEALLDAGLPIDRVGGNSIGGFIAALYASGMDPVEIDARCYEEWVRKSPFSDVTIPRRSMIRGKKGIAMLERNLSGTIEDQPRSLFCISTDLTAGEQVVHRTGSIVTAVAATLSLPGLAPPIAVGDRRLVDGASFDNLPVSLMVATGEGPVIAADVLLYYAASGYSGGLLDDGSPAPSLRERLEEPTWVEALGRALQLIAAQRAAPSHRMADLSIAPPNDDVGLMEFHQIDVLRETGRRAAAEALERAPASLWP